MLLREKLSTKIAAFYYNISETFVLEFLPKTHFIENCWKLAYEEPRTWEKKFSFFKFEGPTLPRPNRLYLR